MVRHLIVYVIYRERKRENAVVDLRLDDEPSVNGAQEAFPDSECVQRNDEHADMGLINNLNE